MGPRKVTGKIQAVMTAFAQVLDNHRAILRSGGGEGTEAAFEAGSTLKVVYLPWNGFNGKEGAHYIPIDAKLTAAHLHPSWAIANSETRLLLARDVLRLCGEDNKSPVKFLVYWDINEGTKATQSNTVVSNLSLIVKHAKSLNIPTFNMAKASDLAIINNVVTTNSLEPLGLISTTLTEGLSNV